MPNEISVKSARLEAFRMLRSFDALPKLTEIVLCPKSTHRKIEERT